MSGSVEVIENGQTQRILNENGGFFGELAIMSEG